MKKILSLVFALIMAAQACQLMAQTNTLTLFTHNCPNVNWQNSVGRMSANDQHIIASHNHDSINEFFSIDPNSNSYTEFDLLPKMLVYDFEMLGGMIYFCGAYSPDGINTYAIVGRFPEPEFYTGLPVNYEYALIPEARALYNMTLYWDSKLGSVVLAAVGGRGTALANFLVTMTINTQINYNYYINFTNLFTFQDITSTDNYIVVSGVNNFSSNQFAVTVIDKSNLTSADIYYPTEPLYDMNTGLYNIEELDGDNVALATIMSDTPNLKFYARIHVFDAANATFVNTQDVPLLNKTTPNEMLYMEKDSTLLLLHTNDYPALFTVNSVIYYLKPYDTVGYMANLVYDTDVLSCSLDRFHYSVRYLATGGMKTREHSYFMRKLNGAYTSPCPIQNTEKIGIVRSPAQEPPNNHPLSSVTEPFKPETSVPTYGNAYIKCQY